MSVVRVELEDSFCSDKAVGRGWGEGLPQGSNGFDRAGRMDYHHSPHGRFRENQRILVLRVCWIPLQIPIPTSVLLLFPHQCPKFCIKELGKLWIQLAVQFISWQDPTSILAFGFLGYRAAGIRGCYISHSKERRSYKSHIFRLCCEPRIYIVEFNCPSPIDTPTHPMVFIPSFGSTHTRMSPWNLQYMST